MKKILLSFVAMVIATVSSAQTSLLATLSHEGEITSFYGFDALKNAVAAAANGDVITLSAGQFGATNIDKSLTIRGAGMGVIDGFNIEPTNITGDCYVGSVDGLFLEGLNFLNTMYFGNGGEQISNCTFVKCTFLEVCKYGTTTNLNFLHCCITNGTNVGNSQFINSIIGDARYSRLGDCSFTNCLLTGKHWYYSSGCSFKNNVIWTYSNEADLLYNTNSYYGNLFVSDAAVNVGASNYVVSKADAANVWEKQPGSWGGSQYAKMNEEYIARYPGIDSLGVGIYGGSLPFSPVTSNPKITKFKVASKSTADGKLSVDISVDIPEE